MSEQQQQQTPPPAWYVGAEGIDDVLVGHIQTKGWDKLTPQAAAIAAAKSHREAEGFVGSPSDQLLKLPKDPGDKEGWGKVWNRLGAPLDPKDYDFSGVKRADGKPVDEKFAAALREAAGQVKLPKDMATSVAASVAKYLDNVEAAAAAEKTAALATQKTELQTNWGANFDANMVVAKRAAAALGVDAATVDALEKQIGYSKVMDMFRAVGQKIGEDKFISSTNNPSGVMTKEQAVERKSSLMRDTDWVKRYNKGDTDAYKEMIALNTIIVGDDTAAMRSRGH